LGWSRDIVTEEAKRNWEILARLGYDLREIMDSSDLPLEKYEQVLDAIKYIEKDKKENYLQI
jgi:hypothetical protein